MYLWMKIAETLGMTLAECYERVSSSEANLWAAYFARKEEQKWAKGSDPMHHYMAVLTSRVTSMWGGRATPPSDLLLEFDTSTEKSPQDWKHQKGMLLAALGIDENASNED